MGISSREAVGRLLEHVGATLGPYLELQAERLFGVPWTEVLRALDVRRGRAGRPLDASDVYAMLRMLTERDPQGRDYALEAPELTPAVRVSASELRNVRNRWAHMAEFEQDDLADAVRNANDVLQAIGAAVVHGADLVTPSVDTDPVQPTPAESISLELQAGSRFINYAFAYNGIPTTATVRVHSENATRRTLRLDVQLTAPQGPLSEISSVMIPVSGSIDSSVEVALRLDARAMAELEHETTGLIRAVLVEPEGGNVAHVELEVLVFGTRQWRATDEANVIALAALVQPNDSRLDLLLHEAGAILAAETGSSAFNVYFDGEDGNAQRIDQAASAIYTAIQKRGAKYAPPPSSWARFGQTVRTPGEVIDDGFGTCLDTTTLYAAALERIGISPQIWLVTGHAFAAYWRKDPRSSWDQELTDSPHELANYVDDGSLVLVETTTMTDNAEPVSFSDASRIPAARWLASNSTGHEDLEWAIDVNLARRTVKPIPARSLGADGAIEFTEYRPSDSPAVAGIVYEHQRSAGQAATSVPARVQQWKNSLLDLTLRNRLINFTESAGISVAVPSADLGHLEDLVNDDRAITLVPADNVPPIYAAGGSRVGRDLPDDTRSQMLRGEHGAFIDVPEARYLSAMRTLAFKAKTIEQETGANNLYLAFGTLEWELEGKALASPLVLVPVRLENDRDQRYRIVHDPSAPSTPNYCLVEKLRQSLDLELPGLAEPEEDGYGIDLDGVFESIRETLKLRHRTFRVQPTVDLAILQFAKFRMWKDLDDNWEVFSENSLVRHLIDTPTSPFDDPAVDSASPDLDELQLGSPIAADSSQLRAVADAVSGRSFVLEGPPGTGKSQTITNLLVQAVLAGKRVLFVAEKQAALSVVQKRLASVGMAPFALDAHDKGSRPAAIRAQLREALDLRVRADTDRLANEQERARGDISRLKSYAERLHEVNPLELSLYRAHGRELSFDDEVEVFDIPDEFLLDTARHAPVRELMRGLSAVADPARPRAENAFAFVDAPSTQGIDASGIVSAIRGMDTAIGAAERAAAYGVLQLVTNVSDLDIVERMVPAPSVDLAAIDRASEPSWGDNAAAAIALLEECMAKARPELAGTHPSFFEVDWTAAYAAALAADASGFFGRKKRQVAARKWLVPVTDPSRLPAPRDVTQRFAAIVEAQNEARFVENELRAINGIELPIGWNPFVDAGTEALKARVQWLRWLGWALGPTSLANAELVDTLRMWLLAPERRMADSVRAVSNVSAAWRALDRALAVHGGSSSLSEWGNGVPVLRRWNQTRPLREREADPVLALRRWHALIEFVEPLRTFGLLDARDAILTDRLAANTAPLALDRSLATASVRERERTTALDAFDGISHSRIVDRFVATSELVRELLPGEIQRRILAHRSFDAALQAGRIGELRRQLDRQRGGLGVRGLFAKFGDLITDITPCVLTSPESVARFIPSGSAKFDIVVFDEASQVRVADAIGAIGRGTSVVVVGDSKQMPPTQFGMVPASGDDEEREEQTVVADEESILSECVAAQVHRTSLTWHYRSQDEALISFSNAHYYDGKLSSFPAPVAAESARKSDGHGVSFVRLQGHFERSGAGATLRTNRVEADAIVAEISARFAESSFEVPSLGVVTFNAQQRALIEGLLRDLGDERISNALDQPDGLFVKNLENVQGDERDVILFSIAFSKNARGSLPLNFGPVGMGGGERRLNVAITRARRQVIVYCSFDPDDLRAEETASIGLRDLKAFLRRARDGAERAASTEFDGQIDFHREDIADELRGRGLVVQTDVGLSGFRLDLVLASAERSDQPQVAILLDGPNWSGRSTVGDRDALPDAVLVGLMRWPLVKRIWLPQWLSERGAVVDEILDAVTRVSASTSTQSLALPVPPPAVRGGSIADDDAISDPSASDPAGLPGVPDHPRDAVVDYRPWDVEWRGGREWLDRLPNGDARARVGEVIREVAEAEGPVHVSRVVALVARAFDLERVSKSRADSILDCVPEDLRRGTDAHFLWPAGLEPGTWRDARGADANDPRDLELIHPVEIDNAMEGILRRVGGMEDDELRRAVLAFFGLKRMTARMAIELDRGVEGAIDRGRILRTDSGALTAPRA